MQTTLRPVQPVSHPESGSAPIECSDDAHRQREIPLPGVLSQAQFCTVADVTRWTSYREAVQWCWVNQRYYVGIKDEGRQLMFARAAGMHPPHVSRCLKAESKAPMNLPPDLIPVFESFTGWRGVSQWLMRQAHLTSLEHMQLVLAGKAA